MSNCLISASCARATSVEIAVTRTDGEDEDTPELESMANGSLTGRNRHLHEREHLHTVGAGVGN